MTDDDPVVRATALTALQRLGRLNTTDVANSLKDPATAVRRRAVLVAARHRNDSGASKASGGSVDADEAVSLLPLLDDDDASVVEAACCAVGECETPEPDAVQGLSRIATSHEDPLCRESAVAALGAIGDPAALPAVLAACEDRATVRRRAVLALAPFEGPEVEAALQRAAEDRDWQVRQAAEDLL